MGNAKLVWSWKFTARTNRNITNIYYNLKQIVELEKTLAAKNRFFCHFETIDDFGHKKRWENISNLTILTYIELKLAAGAFIWYRFEQKWLVSFWDTYVRMYGFFGHCTVPKEKPTRG